jgi:hypothetical protein
MEKSILVSIIAVFAVLTLMSVVSAGDLVTFDEITVNGAEITTSTISGIEGGETIPIKIVFTADTDARDVKVKAEIEGHRTDISDKTGRFELVEGSVYTKYLSLKVPSDIDPTEEYTLLIRISGRDKETDETESDEEEYTLKVQRGSYNLEVLSAELPEKVTPGSVIAVDVILKNRGMHKLEDVFVKVSIPDLSVERKVYFGDLNPLDEDELEVCEEGESYSYCREANRRDSTERRIYLSIPDVAKTGVYSLEVEAYNVDSADLIKRNIIISGVEEVSDVLSAASTKSLDVGEEVIYDLVIVNSGSKMKVYTLTPEETKGLIVETDSIVTVPTDSSKTLKVKVRATESVEEGTHIITINVESEGELVRQVNFSANVERGQASANSVVILTVILAIIFVVLLIILIVLLTKKPTAIEETEETSYY